MHPRIVAALQEQLRVREPGARRVGWKIALGIAEVEELIGPEPVIGNLTTATQLQSGATYRGGGPLHAGAEVAIEVGPDGRSPASESASSSSISRSRPSGWRRSSPPTCCTARSSSAPRGPAPDRARER